MNWKSLTTVDQIAEIISASKNKPVLIFKHSTRCSVSSMALDRLARAWNTEETNNIDTYLLDLIQYRQISNELAEVFNVPHESPQIFIIIDGKCAYNNSHMGISYHEVKRIVSQSEAV